MESWLSAVMHTLHPQSAVVEWNTYCNCLLAQLCAMYVHVHIFRVCVCSTRECLMKHIQCIRTLWSKGLPRLTLTSDL